MGFGRGSTREDDLRVDGAEAGAVHEPFAKVDVVDGVETVEAVAVVRRNAGEEFLLHLVFEILLLFTHGFGYMVDLK